VSEADPQQPRRPAVFYWGLFILAAGLIASALIFILATPDADLAAAEEITKGRGYEHNLQLMGGKFAVLTVEFDQWFASLWQGRPLAYTVAVLSIAIALACFWVARMITPLGPQDARRRRGS
jgi:hypothetical protein